MEIRHTAFERSLWTIMVALALSLGGVSGTHAQRGQQPVPENVTVTSVDIWSEGTRVAGDLYRPTGIGQSDTLPTIVMSHGWGGTKAGLRRYAASFASSGYIVLAFDYRGWGASDSKLVVKGEMPEADENGEATVRVQVIREVIDPFDQILDIRRAFDFIEGEPNVDTERLGYWGSSYSGGHAVWVAANEPRAKVAVGQVAAADSLDLAQTSWGDENIAERARRQSIQRARGEIDPVPQGTDKAPNLRGWAILDKVVDYRPVEDAGRITIPLLIIDAENEELFDRHQAGELAIQRARSNGAPASYHVVPGITHYQIYNESAEEATQLALDWFDEHLK